MTRFPDRFTIPVPVPANCPNIVEVKEEREEGEEYVHPGTPQASNGKPLICPACEGAVAVTGVKTTVGGGRTEFTHGIDEAHCRRCERILYLSEDAELVDTKYNQMTAVQIPFSVPGEWIRQDSGETEAHHRLLNIVNCRVVELVRLNSSEFEQGWEVKEIQKENLVGEEEATKTTERYSNYFDATSHMENVVKANTETRQIDAEGPAE